MKILVVEDERLAAERLIRMVRQIREDVEILDVTESVEQTVNWLTSHPDPDLILMDIQLEDGTSFEVLEAVRVQAPVIFTTAYDSYALRAFRVNSIDYLLKPVDPEALKSALDKYDRLFGKPSVPAGDWVRFLEEVSPRRKQRFLVRSGQKFRSVPASEVALFESQAGNTFLKTFTGQHYDVDLTIGQLEQQLDPARFFRVSRGFVINFDAIAEIIALSGTKLKIKLKNDSSPEGIVVSRDRIAAFKSWMDR